MGVFYEDIPDSLRDWILEQKLFWVATAPLSASGHVNLSPKGGQYFGLIDNRTFWYHELTGSGNETLSHLHEKNNGRLTVMFSAFVGAPKIVRLWGHGRAYERGSKEFEAFVEAKGVKVIPASRSIIILDIHQVGSSCGFSVPFYDFKDFRPTLTDHFSKLEAKHERTGEDKDSLDHYWAYKNSYSIDGLPGMKRGNLARKKWNVTPLKKMIGPMAPTAYDAGTGVSVRYAILIALMSFIVGLLVASTAMNVLQPMKIKAETSRFDTNLRNMTYMPFADGLTRLWMTK